MGHGGNTHNLENAPSKKMVCKLQKKKAVLRQRKVNYFEHRFKTNWCSTLTAIQHMRATSASVFSYL